MKNILMNAEASCVKLCVELAAAMRSLNISTDVDYIELDARVELKDNEIPSNDIIGLTQFSIAEIDKSIWQIHFIIGVSTISDENLFRLRRMANFIYERFPCGAQMIYYDADTADEKSWIQVTPGTVQLPTHRVETRPFRFIQVQAVLDPHQGAEPDPVP